MGAVASQITSLTIVYSAVYSGVDQRKHQSSVSLTFVRGIHRWPVSSSHKWPVTRKMFPFDDAIMTQGHICDYQMIAGIKSYSCDHWLVSLNAWQLNEKNKPLLSENYYYDVIAAICGFCMMTSSNGNIFRVSGPLRGESIGHKDQWRESLVFSLMWDWANG